jgi:transposase
MFDNKIKELSINIYNYLKTMGIIGQERINFITNNFKCHITTFYNWNKEYNDNFNNIYQNKNINPLIVNDILIYCKNNKNVNIKILKNYINKKHNTKFSSNTIIFILKINNLKYKNYKINDEIIKFILNTVEKNNVITSKEIISLINKNFNLLISESSIYNILKKNKITYKRVTIKTNPYTEEEEKETLDNIKYILDELEPNNIISYDEISVTNNEYPVFGWSKSGEKCIVKNRINTPEFRIFGHLFIKL